MGSVPDSSCRCSSLVNGGFSLQYTSQTEFQVGVSWVLHVFHVHTDKDSTQAVAHPYMIEHHNLSLSRCKALARCVTGRKEP